MLFLLLSTFKHKKMAQDAARCKSKSKIYLGSQGSPVLSTPVRAAKTFSVPADINFIPCVLALSYTGLGDKDRAIAAASQAITDYQGDALSKPLAEIALAQVEAQVGDVDAAIAALPHLLEVPAGLTPGLLRFDPYWDPLRKDPRFEKLCQEK